ncbi:MAG: hypothetical protein QM831_43880 [Kofleriaceae bacterium]
MEVEERKLDLYESYRERGFDGRDEQTTYHRLVLRSVEGRMIVTLEIEKESRDTGTVSAPNRVSRPTQDWLKRYEISAVDLVALLQKHATRVL